MNFTMREFMADRLRAYTLLARLDRPVGIYLLLWPTLWSLWLAGNGQPSQTVFVVFVLGVVLMRSAGCVINDYADRDLDTQVERTRDRPLAKGWVTPTEALALAGILLILAFLCVLLTNWLTILMSFVALALAATYPLMKRVHHLPQVHLGLAFGWAIPMAWVAQTGEFPATTAWLLYLANVCWSVAYDTMYALADRDDDIRAGVKSSAILFGCWNRILIGLFQTLTLLLLGIVGLKYGAGAWFYIGVAVATTLATYQQWLIRHHDPAKCLRAFSNNAWSGFAVFTGLFIDLLP